MTKEALLEQLLRSHDPALRRLARVYAGGTGEADDLYQDILLQLWRALPSFRGQSALGTWAYRVALNTALTWRRRAARHERGVRATSDGQTAGAPRNEALLLEEFLQALGPVDRSILLLYMEGMAATVIGDILGMTANGVGVRLHRVKQRYERTYLRD